MMSLWILLVVAVIIICAVALIAIVATNKAYQFQHTIDPKPVSKDAPDEESFETK